MGYFWPHKAPFGGSVVEFDTGWGWWQCLLSLLPRPAPLTLRIRWKARISADHGKVRWSPPPERLHWSHPCQCEVDYRLANSFLKDQVANVLDIGGHSVSLATMQLCLCSVKAARDVMWMSRHGCVSVKRFSKKQVTDGFDPWTSSLLTPPPPKSAASYMLL